MKRIAYGFLWNRSRANQHFGKFQNLFSYFEKGNASQSFESSGSR